MANINDYIKEIKLQIEDLQNNHNKHFETDLLIAYRGEPRDYEKTKLMPSLFRDDNHIQKEMHLFELFCDYNMISSTASNVEKAIEAQHYVAISRMLDISFNVLVALYFACDHTDVDGRVFAFAFPEHYSPHSKYVEEFYTNTLEGKHIAYSRNFKVFSHSYSNDRIKAQKGGFVFFPGNDYFPINSCYYRPIVVKQEDKEKILKDLDVLFQINEASIFPEKDKISKIVKQKFYNNQYSYRSVSIDEEVDTYFNRINYELKLSRFKNSPDYKKEILRLLRKEEADITNYLQARSLKSSSEDCGKLERLLERVCYNFKILRIKFKED